MAPQPGSGWRAPRRLVLSGALLALVASAALVAGRRDPPDRRGSVVATIVLSGGSCRTHKAECAKLADGGTLVIFGPEHKGIAGFPQHRVRLNGATTRINVPLEPGVYNLAFFIQPPWSVLEPDFGKSAAEGFFRVGTHAIQLGPVGPSRNWVLVGD